MVSLSTSLTVMLSANCGELVCHASLAQVANRQLNAAELVDEFYSGSAGPRSLGSRVDRRFFVSRIADLNRRSNCSSGGGTHCRILALECSELLHEVTKNWDEKTIAIVSVKAGSQKKAIDKAKNEIDDALNVLRVSLLALRTAHPIQRLQRRGLDYLVRRAVQPDFITWGGEHGMAPFEIGITGQIASTIENRIAVCLISEIPNLPPEITGPIHRSVQWIGSALTRDNVDDGIIDLCTALEAALCIKGDQSKSGAIALRHFMVKFAAGDTTYYKSPFEIVDLYGLRNRILHESARRVASNSDFAALSSVAVETLDTYMKVLRGDQIPTSNEVAALLALEPGESEEVIRLPRSLPR